MNLPDKKEGVNAVCTVCDRLEQKLFLHNFSQLHVIRVFEYNDTCVTFVQRKKKVNVEVKDDMLSELLTQNNPGHRYSPESMNGRNCIATDSSITDCIKIGHN